MRFLLLLLGFLLLQPALALASLGCSDTGVAELELMKDWELWGAYCPADYEAEAQGQMAKGILDAALASPYHGAEHYAIEESYRYQAEQRKCWDLRDRVGRVLRAKYELEPP